MKLASPLVALLLWPTHVDAQSGIVLRASSTTPTVFDRPLATERVRLPIPRDQPSEKRELTCFHFTEVRVKQLDLGEIGAAQLTILPRKAGVARPPCIQKNLPSEIVISGHEWSGYFTGAKSGYVFFDAEDGTNGGLGFAVFDGRTGAIVRRFGGR